MLSLILAIALLVALVLLAIAVGGNQDLAAENRALRSTGDHR